METLSKEQQVCVDLAMAGHNLVICGQAGSGKSYTVNEIRRRLSIDGKSVSVTATTGIACQQFAR